MSMDDLDESLPPKPWLEMTKAEQLAAYEQLGRVLSASVQTLCEDVNAELAERQCPLRVRGSLSIRWEEDDGKPEGS